MEVEVEEIQESEKFSSTSDDETNLNMSEIHANGVNNTVFTGANAQNEMNSPELPMMDRFQLFQKNNI
jgi:hypothetical protein